LLVKTYSDLINSDYASTSLKVVLVVSITMIVVWRKGPLVGSPGSIAMYHIADVAEWRRKSGFG
jgi:hypothetical protein